MFPLSHSVEPQSYSEASRDPDWIEAMNVEIKALELNNTWVLTDLPKHKSAIGYRWVYKVKHRSDSSIERYKAKLVAKGYTQVKGHDYLDTFSPVAKLTTVRLLLALAAINQWYLKHLDVSNAFLHVHLHGEVYMDIPQGMKVARPEQVCKLQRSLYGLKQASRQWYARLSSFLVSHGYKQCASDHSLFIRHGSNRIFVLLVYVDDIVLLGNELSKIQRITYLLDDTLRIKDFGDLRHFLGFEVARSSNGINLCQRKYALDILNDSSMLGSKPMSTPDYISKLHQHSGLLLSTEEAYSYRRLIGRLIYLTNARPDIPYAVQHLCQFVTNPTSNHKQAAFQILKYLKGTPGAGIFLFVASTIHLNGFSNSDWVGYIDTRRFVTGYVVYIGD